MIRLILLCALIGCTLGGSITPVGRVSKLETELNSENRIVNGIVTNIYQHPYIVSVLYRIPTCSECPYAHLCGGSILSDKIILTAGHCAYGRKVENFLIVGGRNNRVGSNGVPVPVEKIIIHEDYDSWIIKNDIALIYLATSLPLDGYKMSSIKLAQNEPSVNTLARVTGWGALTQNDDYSDELMSVEVPIVSLEQCQAAYQPSEVDETMICAGYVSGGKDACNGDSGGPLTVNNTIVGVVSWGYGCAQPNYPGVYANIANLRSWIEKHLESSLL